ncbi:unnamed protein product (macronuclear) [Paramecium tetraurelia]|uniref:Ras-related protein Rab-1 n=1 Tax=Paramecium tetraurelia TaxID=5888 RepID=Q3SDP0_PARTE|nr:uncharacterized protein GSPATT00035542001 [Paramecium tetraurelia]CAI39318.1 rab_B65 [Paramecium tetraurelia]CAK66413.1 unnamed protein product [Paramecium tetraurelia]|eukprot:XP_001433810.1 hypothetical protein (macronuclear) [Paramecium tetraurelia strain d4-2]
MNSNSDQQDFFYNLRSHFLFKVLLIGNSGVGKSCMLMRYSENQFTNNFYNTIGVDFKTKTIALGEHNVKLQIWDTAGQDRFRTITCSYYRGAQGIIIVYDITDRESFENVKTWMAEIDKYASESVNRLLVGNKADITERREVSYEEGLELSRLYQIPFYETSAKSSTNIEAAFTHITKNILNRELHNTRAVVRKTSNLRLQNRQQQQQQEKKKQEDLCC